MFAQMDWKPVDDRAIAIWPCVVCIVHHWKTRVPSKQLQDNNFEVVASVIDDPLTTVKLKFFSYIASVLKPYFRKYQSNDPLVPIMAVHAIIKTLMRIVYKTGHVSNIMNIKQIKNFNDNNAKKRSIFFGCSVQFELHQLKKKDLKDRVVIFNWRIQGSFAKRWVYLSVRGKYHIVSVSVLL